MKRVVGETHKVFILIDKTTLAFKSIILERRYAIPNFADDCSKHAKKNCELKYNDS